MPKNVCQTKRIKVPIEFDKPTREAIGEDIIEYLVDRTRSGKGKNRSKYRGKEANVYSDSYKKSGTVDLFDTGEMLMAAMKVTVNNVGEIAVGIPMGDDDWGKAKGNILGSYGKSPNKDKARPFLDIGDVDMQIIRSIINEYKENTEVEE